MLFDRRVPPTVYFYWIVTSQSWAGRTRVSRLQASVLWGETQNIRKLSKNITSFAFLEATSILCSGKPALDRIIEKSGNIGRGTSVLREEEKEKEKEKCFHRLKPEPQH
jgi:hypothetical protein